MKTSVDFNVKNPSVPEGPEASTHAATWLIDLLDLSAMGNPLS